MPRHHGTFFRARRTLAKATRADAASFRAKRRGGSATRFCDTEANARHGTGRKCRGDAVFARVDCSRRDHLARRKNTVASARRSFRQAARLRFGRTSRTITARFFATTGKQAATARAVFCRVPPSRFGLGLDHAGVCGDDAVEDAGVNVRAILPKTAVEGGGRSGRCFGPRFKLGVRFFVTQLDFQLRILFPSASTGSSAAVGLLGLLLAVLLLDIARAFAERDCAPTTGPSVRGFFADCPFRSLSVGEESPRADVQKR